MITLHTLTPAKGAVRNDKRLGRGRGSGGGGTATRGHKGAKSRSGYSYKTGFEGGQMPLQRRVPKYGFKNPFKITYKVINLDQLQELATQHNVNTIDIDFLKSHGFISKKDKVKVLSRGELSTALQVRAHACSKAAEEALKNAGGSFTAI
jgi:large subunit ribosomal protein L15